MLPATDLLKDLVDHFTSVFGSSLQLERDFKVATLSQVNHVLFITIDVLAQEQKVLP